MRINNLIKSCVLVSCLLGITTPAFADENKLDNTVEQPNVLFIIVDDLNDYLGAFGGHPQSKTPNIDALAAQSTQFTNAHTNVPVCSPSRSSLFTGVYPHQSKDFGWTKLDQQHVLKHNKTFLELFRKNGYQMLGTGKLLHQNKLKFWDEWGVQERINYGPHAYNGNKIVGHPSVPEPFRSINIVDGSFAPLTDVPKFKLDSTTKLKRAPGWGYPFAPFRYVSEDDRDRLPDEQHAIWASNKLKQLEQSNTQKPFFMGVGFVRPHTPLYAPKRFFDMFPLETLQLPNIKKGDVDDTPFKDNYPMSQMGLSYFKALQNSYADDDEGLKKVIQAYLACIAFMDEQLGIVINALNNSKFKDNTIVVFTSDHGWQFGEKDYLYKNSPWEESTKIPMLWKVPGKSIAGLKVDQPVSLIDIYPTFQQLANLKGSTANSKGAGSLGGYSIAPLLNGKSPQSWQGPEGALTIMGVGIDTPIEGLAVGTNPHALWHVKVIKDLPDEYIWQQTYSYRTKDWRYIRYKDGQEELYDHRSDPYEWHNLALNKEYDLVKAKLISQMTEIVEKK
ncbi:sulfatase [Colwelliaceae bacterium BS250]